MAIHNKWRKIDQLLYRELYNRIHDTSKVFGTSTDMDGRLNGKMYIMTEWGFSDADAPLIRYEKNGDNESFYINSPCLIED